VITVTGVQTCALPIIFDARTNPGNNIKIPLAFKGQDVSGVGLGTPVEQISITEFYLCANSKRVAKIDTVTGKLYCRKFEAGEPPVGVPVEGPYLEYDGIVYWQIFDSVNAKWKPFMCVDSNDNRLIFCMAVKTI
jgi:hypothetical protein